MQQEKQDGRFLCVLWSRDRAEGRSLSRVRNTATWDVTEKRERRVATVEAGYPPVREAKDSDAEGLAEFHRGACCRI